jgi:hypothetical protein
LALGISLATMISKYAAEDDRNTAKWRMNR